jgi:hypothetical protein
MVTATFKLTVQATKFEFVVKRNSMDTKEFKALVWVGAEGREFVIDDIQPGEGGLWVFYHNVNTAEKHSCLLDAFTSRFTYKEPSQ